MLKDFAIAIVRTLREHGFQAYLCGGCVRDMVLGRTPADYDVTTDATPQQVMRIFPETYAVGAQFGVVLVPLPKESGSGPSTPGEALTHDAITSADTPTDHSKANVVEVATF